MIIMPSRLEIAEFEMSSLRTTKSGFFGKNEKYTYSEKIRFCDEHHVSGTRRIELKISTDTQGAILYN